MSSIKNKYSFLKLVNTGQELIQWEKVGTLPPQHGQQFGQFSDTSFLLMDIKGSNLNPHLIREIQKKPR